MTDARTEATSLSDRYIQAVIRTIPEAQRDDVAAELGASIADQLDARLAAGEAPEAAEREVLTALGDPDALAAGLADRPLQLIGPRYYLDWLRLLKLLLWIVVPLAAFGVALGQTLAGATIGGIVGTTIGTAVSVVVHVAFWTTLVFALLERSDDARRTTTSARRSWSPDDLPHPHAAGTTFADMIVSIAFLIVGAAAVVWDQVVGLVYLDGRWMPFLSPALAPWWLGGLLLLMAIEVGFQVVLHARRRWTPALAAVNVVLNLAFLLPALWLLSQSMLLNPAFWQAVIPEPDADKVYGILSVLTGFGIAAIAIWDSIDGYLKARRSR